VATAAADCLSRAQGAWIHTDKRIKKDLILGVASQIALVAVVVVLAMMAQHGVLDQALAK
jgi:hypothetical protein